MATIEQQAFVTLKREQPELAALLIALKLRGQTNEQIMSVVDRIAPIPVVVGLVALALDAIEDELGNRSE